MDTPWYIGAGKNNAKMTTNLLNKENNPKVKEDLKEEWLQTS